MSQLILRFFIGGTIVSIFALMGDLFKPKSLAGLFGAAPSVALATLALTVRTVAGVDLRLREDTASASNSSAEAILMASSLIVMDWKMARTLSREYAIAEPTDNR